MSARIPPKMGMRCRSSIRASFMARSRVFVKLIVPCIYLTCWCRSCPSGRTQMRTGAVLGGWPSVEVPKVSLSIGAVAQFERDLIIERTKAGLTAAKKRGKRLQPPLKRSPEMVKKARTLMMKDGLNAEDVCESPRRVPPECSVGSGQLEITTHWSLPHAGSMQHPPENVLWVSLATISLFDPSHFAHRRRTAHCRSHPL